MSKSLRPIRKNNQRVIKKSSVKTTKNIFLYDSKFESILPKSIYNKLLQTSEFAVSLVEQYIGHPDQGVDSLQLMKLALIDQQMFMKSLTNNTQQSMDMEKMQSFQNPEQHNDLSDKQHNNETKQSLNSNNEMAHHMENDYDDNIFLPLDSLINEPKRHYNEDNHDYFHFEERNFATSIPPNDELDILSLID